MVKYIFLVILFLTSFVQASLYVPDSGLSKNKLQNGDMAIDQRNEGASVATVADATVYLDRWKILKANAGVTSIQRATDSLPVGFAYALKLVATTADASLAAGDVLAVWQMIEGSNVADFAFGASTAQSVTFSFWTRSSKTGTYCVSIMNSAANRSFVAEYTISAANTWEKKIITIPGDQSGTWLTAEGTIGLRAHFTVMAGSTFQQTAGSWGTSGNAVASANQVNWMDTINATFYITGVQLETGSQATSFEQKDINVRYAEVQRFYEKTYNRGVAVATNTGTGTRNAYGVTAASTVTYMGTTQFVAPKYANPTVALYSLAGTASKMTRCDTDADAGTGATAQTIGMNGFRYISITTGIAGTQHSFHYTAETGF